MVQKYLDYECYEACPWSCVGGVISNDLREYLKNLYSNPDALLSFIKEIRNKLSPDVCPMCGSSKTGTIDHYLPKSSYPEWAIYSKNLVPACDCNSQRGDTIKGTNPYEKIIHPYFDNGLDERIITAQFSGDYYSPDISIVPINNTQLHLDTIQFHINSIIKRTNAITWMHKKWQNMRHNLRSVIPTINRYNEEITITELQNSLKQALEDRDIEFRTPNNWWSMFISGIINNSDARSWLLTRYNGIVSGSIDQLS